MKIILKTKWIPFIVFLFSAITVYSQTTKISGKVVDSEGIAVIGANVVAVGTTLGTVTDIDGTYTLEIPSETKTISFSFIGYLPETIQVNPEAGGTQMIDVILSEDLLKLEDVVVIGYGTQKKSDLTSAVASISAEDLEDIHVARVDQALQGRAAGIHVIANTGAPGAAVQVRVRGVTSVNTSNAMWIVDGVGADPRTINMNDIERIEVLKDASAAAIYGANGANGVVLVTTKKGKSGKTSATLNINYGIQQVPKSTYIDMADGPQFGKMYTEYEALLRKRNFYFTNPDTLPTYDYQDMVFRKAPMQNYELGVSGGSEKSNFYVGIGYTSQAGVLKNSDYEKMNIRIKSEAKLNKWITVGENVTINKQNYNGYEEWQLTNEYHTPILSALNYHPFVAPYYDTLGNPATSKTDISNWSFSPLGNTGNPMSSIDLLEKQNDNFSTKATVYLDIMPVKGLTITSRLTGDINYYNSYQFSPIYFITPSNYNANSKISRHYGDSWGWGWQNYATYSNTLFDAHNFTVMAGYESGEWFSKGIGATRWDLINENPEMWYFDASQNDTILSQLPGGSASEGAQYSILGRASYDYKGIFLGQLIIRRDSHSNFGPRKKHGVFPSWSVGIKFTEFEFVKNALPVLNFGKIRYGQGKIGNNIVPAYVPYSTVAMADVYQYSFDNTPVSSLGAAKNKLANPSIAWESMITRNIGLDLGFLSNRLSVTFDLFKRFNDGMILQTDIPGIAGWIVRAESHEGGKSEPFANVGQMINKGIEFQAGWKESRGKFKYSVDFNYTYVTTQAKDLPGGDTLYKGAAKGISGYLTWTTPNGPLSEYYGYVTEGIFRPEDAEEIDGKLVVTNQPYTTDPETNERIYAQPNAQPGDFKFKDINIDGKLNNKDITAIGNPNPKHLLGININVEYGWFDFNLFLQGAMGYKVFNATKFYMFNMDGGFNWGADFVENHYREDIYNRAGDVLLFPANHDGKYPRLDPRNVNQNFSRISDFYMEDASYLRIKNIQLGMTLPKKWTLKAGLEQFRVYAGVSNLLTFTKYSGYDPEVGSNDNLVQGLDKAAYPRARMISFGANIKF